MSRAELAVWLGDEPVGTLARLGRRFELRFARSPGAAAELTIAPEGAEAVWTPAFTRAVIADTLETLAIGIADADHRHPTAPGAMREAVEVQLHRLSTSDW